MAGVAVVGAGHGAEENGMDTGQLIGLGVVLFIFLFGLVLVVTGHGIGGGKDHSAYRDPLDPRDDLR